MSIDRKSFRIGIATTLLVLSVGMVSGFILSASLNWTPLGQGGPAEPPKIVAPPVVAAPGVEQPFVTVSRAVTPAVVNIATTRVVRTPQSQAPRPFDDPFFRQFFGDEFSRRFQAPRERREQSLGSGVIVDPNGYIVTNNHVVAKADEIKVLLNDKREFKGKVVGTDPRTDIAVVKIDGKDLPAIPWGDSDKLQVGEYVLAVGNPFGLNQTVTMGIVSAVGRANVGIADYEDFIQTDAAINPGNSGGALVNVRGELIGINTAIFSQSGGYMGIGFAVPSDMTRAVMDSLIKSGKVVRGWLGVSIQDVTPELAKQFGLADSKGALVSEVFETGPAAKAGIKRGDVIVGFDAKPVENATILRNIVAQTPPDKKIKVELLRDKKRTTVDVSIAEQPKDLAQSADGAAGEAAAAALAGLQARDLTPEIAHQLNLPAGIAGVVVTTVEPGSAAEMAGVERGDLITEINRQSVGNLRDYRRVVGKLEASENVLLLINRQGRNMFIVIKP